MKNQTKKAKKRVVLVITDGIGYNESSEWNAFANAKKPTYDWLFANAPYSLLCSFGEEIGLPQGQMGNSEVGHMCMGAGRVLYQDLVKITRALDSGELAHNATLLDFAKDLSVVHLCGLASDGGVHSHISHLLGLAKILEAMGKKVWIHAITDGRDIPPLSAPKFIEQILSAESKSVKLGSICGRFYAMDRDNRWERVKVAYECLVEKTFSTAIKNTPPQPLPQGEGLKDAKNSSSLAEEARGWVDSAPLARDFAIKYLESQFSENITDEFINPARFNGFSGIKDGEGFIFTNFRSDRAREIIRALGESNFSEFPREKKDIKILCMCEYDAKFPYPVLFPKENVSETLAQIISENHLTQSHIAETEKYAHVTFFFNGGREEALRGENRVLIPSPKVKTYDLKPEMSAEAVCDAVLGTMKNKSDFIVVNFANGDMVGHTGNYEACIKAVEAVDRELGRIIECAKANDYAVIITSDHGNCEKMKDENGKILTNHTVGFVWCFVVDKSISRVKDGGLNNIAPSVLKLMGLEVPKVMSEPLF